jgi:uncharacterized protein (TIGR03032 family)
MSIFADLVADKTFVVTSPSDQLLQFSLGAWTKVYFPPTHGMWHNGTITAIGTQHAILVMDPDGQMVSTLRALDGDVHDLYINDKNEIYATHPEYGIVTYNMWGSTPVWCAPGSTLGVPDKRSCVNGMAARNGKPVYVTSLGLSNTEHSWKALDNGHREPVGVMLDVETNETVLSDLLMPHSPLIDGDVVWFLESGYGRLCRWDIGSATASTALTLDGFTRGLTRLSDDHLAIAVSQGRHSATPISTLNPMAVPGIAIYNTRTDVQEDFVPIDVREVFALHVLPKVLA